MNHDPAASNSYSPDPEARESQTVYADFTRDVTLSLTRHLESSLLDSSSTTETECSTWSDDTPSTPSSLPESEPEITAFMQEYFDLHQKFSEYLVSESKFEKDGPEYQTAMTTLFPVWFQTVYERRHPSPVPADSPPELTKVVEKRLSEAVKDPLMTHLNFRPPNEEFRFPSVPLVVVFARFKTLVTSYVGNFELPHHHPRLATSYLAQIVAPKNSHLYRAIAFLTPTSWDELEADFLRLAFEEYYPSPRPLNFDEAESRFIARWPIPPVDAGATHLRITLQFLAEDIEAMNSGITYEALDSALRRICKSFEPMMLSPWVLFDRNHQKLFPLGGNVRPESNAAVLSFLNWVRRELTSINPKRLPNKPKKSSARSNKRAIAA